MNYDPSAAWPLSCDDVPYEDNNLRKVAGDINIGSQFAASTALREPIRWMEPIFRQTGIDGILNGKELD